MLSGTNDRRVMDSPQRSLATSSGTMTRGPSIDELRVCQYHRALGEIHTLPVLLAFFSLPHTFTSPTTRFVCPPPSPESGTSSSLKTRVCVPCFLTRFSVPFCLRWGAQLREGHFNAGTYHEARYLTACRVSQRRLRMRRTP